MGLFSHVFHEVEHTVHKVEHEVEHIGHQIEHEAERDIHHVGKFIEDNRGLLTAVSLFFVPVIGPELAATDLGIGIADPDITNEMFDVVQVNMQMIKKDYKKRLIDTTT